MVAVGSRSLAEATRSFLEIPGFSYFKSQWMATSEDPALSPTVFLIEQLENTVLAAHFHLQNQFQLFVEGTGKIGSHDIVPLTVHYAGAFTGYGPLVAGSEGLKYFTLRPVFERGGIPVKGAKGKMRKGPKRGAEVGPVRVPTIEDLAGQRDIVHDDLIPIASDGLAVVLSTCPPNATLEEIDGGASQGRFLFVAQGSLIHAGQELRQWESLYLTDDEDYPVLKSGAGGAAVLSLFVPPKHPRYLDPEPDGTATANDAKIAV
ncbi:hypothetical protein GCM10009087_50040 [Sphingomonas oligophenolica]|uniref:Pirin C-terminal domain-containing protein n=1 Tax=Sphingomonas oligophenolica TaxID=301154 RepID=A0ABU9YB29_9SPHN